MDNKFAQQLKKGVLDMVVLRLVQEKSTYGYEILQNLEQRGEGFFDLKGSHLRPCGGRSGRIHLCPDQ